MRIVHPTVGRRWSLRRAPGATDRAARIERLGMLATTLVLAMGLWLTYVGQTSGVPDCPAGQEGSAGPQNPPYTASAPCPLTLTAVRSSQDLLPVLDMFPEPAERRAVAAVLFERVARDAETAPLEHVGGLAELTIPAERVKGDRRLARLNERLRAHPSAAAVAALSAQDLAALKPSVAVRTLDQYRRRVIGLAALFMMAFWLAHLVRWWAGTTGDAVLLPIVHLLSGLGLMMMLAMRDPLRDMVIAASTAWGSAAGCAIVTAVSVVDFENPRLRRAVLPPLTAAVLLALALLIFGSGPTGSGVKVNLFGVQPVEAIRLLVAFALAAYFARRWLFLRELSEERVDEPPSWRLRPPRWKDVRPLVLTIATLLLFFFLQQDLGPALVMSCVFLGLYGLSRGRGVLVACGFGALAAGVAIGHAFGVPETVTRRVAIWLDPWGNALPGGEQIAHALWALSSGSAWGLGPGVGDPQLIPAGHTDLVLAALGEELGYTGVACVIALFVLLTWRTLRIALRAPGDYTFFLAAGLTLGLAVQAFVISGGTLGALPLAGVVTPFLSYGRSAMLSNFAAIGICAAIARRAGSAREPFVAPSRALGWTLAAAAALIAVRAGMVQVSDADRVAARAALTQQADGGHRYVYNPRLITASRQLERGTIVDRTGLPLATSRPGDLTGHASRLRHLGLSGCPEQQGTRCYPLGGLAFHLLGDAESEMNWAARNASFAEQDFDARLKGFDDRPRTVRIDHAVDGATVFAVRRDYSELLPLVRHRGNPTHPDVVAITTRNRDLRLTIDAELQVMVARALRARVAAAGARRGAAVVIDAASGALLASATYPWPDERELRGAAAPAPERLLDRARYGLYPPGSTFKLVTAVAALRTQGEQQPTFACERLGDGRVGGRVAGTGAVIRDDPQDHTPHGSVGLDRALVVSCNAYFGRLAQQLGSKALADAAAAAQISVASPPLDANLRRSLAHAGYGQGEVVATPLRMARVAAALATDGRLREVRVADDAATGEELRWISESGAARLRRDMREVVTAGTGRALAGHPVAIGGKTGTAEVDHAASHAWFVGFAPYSSSEPARIAFAVIVENGGYGGRVAAPLAGDIVSAAQARGLLK
jgi:cell division protein FtsW (lipid II flippase)